jgi:hypothetical protein
MLAESHEAVWCSCYTYSCIQQQVILLPMCIALLRAWDVMFHSLVVMPRVLRVLVYCVDRMHGSSPLLLQGHPEQYCRERSNCTIKSPNAANARKHF